MVGSGCELRSQCLPVPGVRSWPKVACGKSAAAASMVNIAYSGLQLPLNFSGGPDPSREIWLCGLAFQLFADCFAEKFLRQPRFLHQRLQQRLSRNRV